MRIWLADLTYTQQTVASDTFPAAVGMIGAYARERLSPRPEVRIFKYPEDLARAFEEEAPEVIGFSNYVWNASLSYAFAAAVRRHFPKTVIVMGGPNFPTVPREQERVLRENPQVDFFLMKEAELAFLKLVAELQLCGLDVERFSETEHDLPNLVYVDRKGRFHTTVKVERVAPLTELPSPYLNGDLDRFFDGRLLPIVQTNRGCPFSCTFCTEGQSYWNKVSYKAPELVRGELEYIAEKFGRMPGSRSDLLIADSNFGMYEGDLDTCRVIADTQARHGYPKYINVATGKNKKERVLEAARLVNGAMKLAGSVQSLDPGVMKNIKRANIAGDAIVEMAMRSAEIGTNTYSEVILALPGDSKEAHFKTLQTLIDSGFNTVSMYQLMILPGTEMGTEESKREHKMRLKYRVVPRCFGYFRFRGETIVAAEIEEICVENATLPYADYLDCRKMNFLVNVFFNDSVFSELLKLIRAQGLSVWDWLLRVHRDGERYSPRFNELIGLFLKETHEEVWDSREDLRRFALDVGVIDKYIAGEYGSNLIFKYKALSLTAYFDCLAEVAARSAEDFLRESGAGEQCLALAREIVRFNALKVADIFGEDHSPRRGTFEYDVPAFARAPERETARFRRPRPAELEFSHTSEQAREIEGYVKTFGRGTAGLSRILSRVFLKKFFRNADPAANDGGTVYFGQAVVGQ